MMCICGHTLGDIIGFQSVLGPITVSDETGWEVIIVDLWQIHENPVWDACFVSVKAKGERLLRQSPRDPTPMPHTYLREGALRIVMNKRAGAQPNCFYLFLQSLLLAQLLLLVHVVMVFSSYVSWGHVNLKKKLRWTNSCGKFSCFFYATGACGEIFSSWFAKL